MSVSILRAWPAWSEITGRVWVTEKTMPLPAHREAARPPLPPARCLTAGAAGVTVWDCHGTGVNLDYNLFDKRCEFMLGAGSRLRFPGIEEGYAGVLFLGYHAYDAPGRYTCARVFLPRPFRASGSTANRSESFKSTRLSPGSTVCRCCLPPATTSAFHRPREPFRGRRRS